MLGADYYETDAEVASLLAEGRVPVGIGENTKIKYLKQIHRNKSSPFPLQQQNHFLHLFPVSDGLFHDIMQRVHYRQEC